MREVLERLGTNPGIVGSLVATTDGMVVESHLRDMDRETAAAFASSLLMAALGLLDACGRPCMQQLELRASRGKIIVTNLGNAYLVVATDRTLDLKQGLIEIKSASATLRRVGKICV